MKKSMLLFAVLLALVSFQPAQAITFDLAGVNYPSSILASVDFTYTPLSSNLGKIGVTIANTSIEPSELTGFGFNTPANVTGLGAFTGPSGWSSIFNPNAINTPGQFGYFDLAAITGPNFNGGKPLNGIGDTESASFVINVIGTNMNSLTAMSFLSLLSDLDGKTGTGQYFIARYQEIGTCGEGSDVATPAKSVPEPATALLLVFAGLGLASLRTRVNANE